mmetsp:Transcript_22388/g.45692  ORF Transcript_22388/g.45692 Transcript_22388/m.45692 type:complete len:331 (-) Transcript_22388:443-1435(-)
MDVPPVIRIVHSIVTFLIAVSRICPQGLPGTEAFELSFLVLVAIVRPVLVVVPDRVGGGVANELGKMNLVALLFVTEPQAIEIDTILLRDIDTFLEVDGVTGHDRKVRIPPAKAVNNGFPYDLVLILAIVHARGQHIIEFRTPGTREWRRLEGSLSNAFSVNVHPILIGSGGFETSQCFYDGIVPILAGRHQIDRADQFIPTGIVKQNFHVIVYKIMVGPQCHAIMRGVSNQRPHGKVWNLGSVSCAVRWFFCNGRFGFVHCVLFFLIDFGGYGWRNPRRNSCILGRDGRCWIYGGIFGTSLVDNGVSRGGEIGAGGRGFGWILGHSRLG